MEDWWMRSDSDRAPDWWYSEINTMPDWWMTDGADEYGPFLNVGVGYMRVGSSFVVGIDPIGTAAVGTTLYVG
jgi:hypothetical protein